MSCFGHYQWLPLGTISSGWVRERGFPFYGTSTTATVMADKGNRWFGDFDEDAVEGS
ncbi:hypothetical protein TIFTF001_015863 [Ficus carica]|uniref:Uncharacterized protein n=1 Tax=Ficus carica TaxID=3494 RepID=A0AA88A6M9_FICCA|nr:hypothetical protein TIFTF001_015863 [Ficus carica]